MKPEYTPSHKALASILPIFDAFAHRHRNQHSNSHWWAAFNILRRAVRNLDASLLSAPRPSVDVKILDRAAWLAQHVVPRSYVAFTQLAADNQHAPLGLLLLAVLARVNTAISGILPEEQPPLDPSLMKSDPSSAVETSSVDMGVAVSREAIISSTAPLPSTTKTLTDLTSTKRKKATSDEEVSKKVKAKDSGPSRDGLKDSKKKKKKKKERDEFASIFGSL